MIGMKKGGRRPNMDGINLMAAILLCYPEIGTVSYEPKEEALHFVFRAKKMLPQEKLDELKELVEESIETYHRLEELDDADVLRFYMEGDDELAFLTIERDVRTVSRGEISMLRVLVHDALGEDLVVEGEKQEEGELNSREEVIDHMLTNLRGSRAADYIVGVREDGKVTVYNK